MDKDLGKAFEAMLEAETRLDQALRIGGHPVFFCRKVLHC
jgi:hypothetical protein